MCDIESAIEAIGKRAGVEGASYRTKSAGMQALWGIGISICGIGDDVLGHEVKEHLWQEVVLEASMHKILDVMSMDERARLCQTRDHHSRFIDKMWGLEVVADANDEFETLDDVIGELRAFPV